MYLQNELACLVLRADVKNAKRLSIEPFNQVAHTFERGMVGMYGPEIVKMRVSPQSGIRQIQFPTYSCWLLDLLHIHIWSSITHSFIIIISVLIVIIIVIINYCTYISICSKHQCENGNEIEMKWIPTTGLTTRRHNNAFFFHQSLCLMLSDKPHISYHRFFPKPSSYHPATSSSSTPTIFSQSPFQVMALFSPRLPHSDHLAHSSPHRPRKDQWQRPCRRPPSVNTPGKIWWRLGLALWYQLSRWGRRTCASHKHTLSGCMGVYLRLGWYPLV